MDVQVIPKLQSGKDEIIQILIYLMGEYGAPTTDYGKQLILKNLGQIILNGNFNTGYIPIAKVNKIPDTIITTDGIRFYNKLINLSSSGKLNADNYELSILDIMNNEYDAPPDRHGDATSKNNIGTSSKYIEMSSVNSTDSGTDSGTGSGTDSDTDSGTDSDTDSDSRSTDKSIIKDTEIIDKVNLNKNEQLGGTHDMGLNDTDTLALVLELMNRINNANKLKTLDITLAQSSIDNLAKSLAAKAHEKFKQSDDSIEYHWSTSTTMLPSSKTIYGVNYNEVKETLSIKKAMILEGVPGTGKSQLMFNLIGELTNNNPKHFKIISFNQTTSYGEFMEGLRQVNGQWKYVDGTFLSFCKQADADRSNNYYFGIDEISRGDTESIFGELLTAIECRDTVITLQSGNTLVVPSNLYIIGTMNTLDRSSKFIDRATADRFSHYRMEPQWTDKYRESITIAPEALSIKESIDAALIKLFSLMNEVNSILEKEGLHGHDNIIGTRAISINNMTMEKLRYAIKYSIVPEIQNKRTMCSRSTSDSLESCIDDLLNI